MSNVAVREATVRAVVMGVGFGAVFGAANAYLGLRVGLTIATSIPVAVMTVALPRLFGARVSILGSSRDRVGDFRPKIRVEAACR
jgi:uncharacterized oligopeptide transporter (OPT) family protein